MGLFDQLDGARTVARLASAPNGQIYGTFHKLLPLVPLWQADGNCRMGFTQLFNGYVRGPENTSLDMLQSAVKLGQIPGVPVDVVVTPEDYYDSLYIMAGSTSIFDAYVHLPEEHPAQPPTPPASNDAATIAALNLQVAGLQSQVKTIVAANNKARKLAQTLLDQYPARGGGSWVQLGKTSLPPIIDALTVPQ